MISKILVSLHISTRKRSINLLLLVLKKITLLDLCKINSKALTNLLIMKLKLCKEILIFWIQGKMKKCRRGKMIEKDLNWKQELIKINKLQIKGNKSRWKNFRKLRIMNGLLRWQKTSKLLRIKRNKKRSIRIKLT